MAPPSLLAEYLRARRKRVSPEDVGLTSGPTARRVPGLRREEVALLAGISPDYYLRLEQGRELHPSPAVLEGLARALNLDLTSTDHLYQLAWPQSAPASIRTDVVSDNVLTLTQSLRALPLHVNNRYLDLLYVSPLNHALAPTFVPGNNLARMVFMAPVAHDDYWLASTKRVVAHLRASVGPSDDSPELRALVQELSDFSPRFSELWERHDVGSPAGFPMAFYRPDVGHMEFRYQTFTLPATGGQELGIFSPAPGGPSARALELLSLMLEQGTAQASRKTPERTWGFPDQHAP